MDKAFLVCILSIAIIIAAPWYKSSYSIVENTLVRLLLVVAVLAAVSLGPLPGVLTLLAVITLLIERNQYVLTHLPYQKATSHIPDHQAEHVVKASYLEPDVDTVKSEPKKEDAVEYVDSNPRLPAGPPATAAVAFYKSKGLA